MFSLIIHSFGRKIIFLYLSLPVFLVARPNGQQDRNDKADNASRNQCDFPSEAGAARGRSAGGFCGAALAVSDSSGAFRSVP